MYAYSSSTIKGWRPLPTVPDMSSSASFAINDIDTSLGFTGKSKLTSYSTLAPASCHDCTEKQTLEALVRSWSESLITASSLMLIYVCKTTYGHVQPTEAAWQKLWQVTITIPSVHKKKSQNTFESEYKQNEDRVATGWNMMDWTLHMLYPL